MRNNLMKISIFLTVFILLCTSVGFAYDTNTVSDLVGIFKNVEVPKDTIVEGNVVAIFGNVEMHGQVNGDVVTVFGNVLLDGAVKRNAVTVIGGMKITDQGRIEGDAVQVLGGGMEESPGAYVGGEKVSVASVGSMDGSWIGGLILAILLFTLGKIIIGYVMSVIAVLIFPQQFESMAETVQLDLGKKFLIGALMIGGFNILSILLVMVIIGIPFVLLLTPCMVLLGFTGNTAVKLAIGRKVAKAYERNWSQMMVLFIGALVYGVVEMTIIGKTVIWVGKAMGIGAVIESKAGTKGPLVDHKILD